MIPIKRLRENSAARMKAEDEDSFEIETHNENVKWDMFEEFT